MYYIKFYKKNAFFQLLRIVLGYLKSYRLEIHTFASTIRALFFETPLEKIGLRVRVPPIQILRKNAFFQLQANSARLFEELST